MAITDVCQWELKFSFREKERCDQFIKKLLKLDYVLAFSYSSYFEDSHHIYVVEIEGPWASNLIKVAKMIDKVDYKDS